MWNVLTAVGLIALSIVVAMLLHIIRALYDTQVRLLKDHYRLRGEIAMLMGMVSVVESVDPPEESNTTTVEVDLEHVKEAEVVDVSSG
jgi:hypothetical protein